MNISHFSKHHSKHHSKISDTNKFNKYCKEYHRCKVEIYMISNVIKYDMQTYVNAILNK